MQMRPVIRTRYGVVGSERTLVRSTGEAVTIPSPLTDLGDGMAAIPDMQLDGDDRVAIDLTTWFLRDMQRGRDVGLVLTCPTREQLSRLATRYVREAREFPEHEAIDWAHHIVAEGV